MEESYRHMHMDLVYIQKSFIVTTQHISSIELSSGMAKRCAKDRGRGGYSRRINDAVRKTPRRAASHNTW